MAQGDIIRKLDTRELISTSPVKPSGAMGVALVAAIARIVPPQAGLL